MKSTSQFSAVIALILYKMVELSVDILIRRLIVRHVRILSYEDIHKIL
jgi:hypothetical protein